MNVAYSVEAHSYGEAMTLKEARIVGGQQRAVGRDRESDRNVLLRSDAGGELGSPSNSAAD